MKTSSPVLSRRLLAPAFLCLTAFSAFALPASAEIPLHTEKFERITAAPDGSAKLPKDWVLETYGSSPDTKPAFLVQSARGPDGSTAPRIQVSFKGGDYRGVLLSSPAIATEVATYGAPLKLVCSIFSAQSKHLEIQINSQKADYTETGTLTRSVELKGGEWTKVELKFNEGQPLGDFSVFDAHLVCVFHSGNSQGYGPDDVLDLIIDDFAIISSGR